MKPKHLLVLGFALFLGNEAIAQRLHYIKLVPEIEAFKDCPYYIDSVVDDRPEKGIIGMVQKGPFNVRRPAELEGGFSGALQNYFDAVLPQSSDRLPLTVVFRKLLIYERTRLSKEYAYAELEVAFYSNGKMIFSSVQEEKSQSIDVTKDHPANIVHGLQNAILNLIKAAPQDEPLTRDSIPNLFPAAVVPKEVGTAEEPKSSEIESRDILAVGYQIGGYTLLGLNYEVRVSDVFAIHFGAGFKGYTAGIKIHTGPSRNSPFFNLSYKDGGFGLLQVAAMEVGKHIPLDQKASFGLHAQVGVAKILYIDNALSRELFKGSEETDVLLSIGIGFSWGF